MIRGFYPGPTVSRPQSRNHTHNLHFCQQRVLARHKEPVTLSQRRLCGRWEVGGTADKTLRTESASGGTGQAPSSAGTASSLGESVLVGVAHRGHVDIFLKRAMDSGKFFFLALYWHRYTSSIFPKYNVSAMLVFASLNTSLPLSTFHR